MINLATAPRFAIDRHRTRTDSHSSANIQDRGAAMKPAIRLRGISDDVKGKIWKSDSDVRVGKLASLEIVLEDGSISRNHAELKAEPGGWTVRDLSSTNGTFVN